MRRNRLRLPSTLQHEKLGQDGNALQPYGEGPQDFRDFVAIGEEDAKDCGAAEEVLDFEGVDVGVVGGFVIVEHEVEGVGLGGEEEEFKCGVVEGAGC